RNNGSTYYSNEFDSAGFIKNREDFMRDLGTGCAVFSQEKHPKSKQLPHFNHPPPPICRITSVLLSVFCPEVNQVVSNVS
ncbi:hypothetical protein ApAK_00470, partial [Thermoplasmatales archaeon AK]|nr:hypothetical protein [Thermoplasmatales archaeon AK]